MERKYMKGRDVKHPPIGYNTCPFFEHDYVDSAPCNVVNTETNKDKMDYQILLQHLTDYTNKKRPDHSLSSTGKELKKLSAPTMLKL